MNPYVSLLIGVACAGAGGELFVRGLVGLAHRARISAGIVATTVAAFATSSPELSVAMGAASSGHPEISLGDTLGSNVVNLALILAIPLCVSSFNSPSAGGRRDLVAALLVPIALAAFGFDGLLSRADGVALLVLFTIWLALLIRAARRDRPAAAHADGMALPRPGAVMAPLAAGLALLVGSGHFIVQGGRGIAAAFGVPEFVIGATLVALGTSMPEFATTVVAKLRGHDDISLGNLLGSTVFNGLFIVGLVAVICPIAFVRDPMGSALAFGLAATVLVIPRRDGWIPRWRGAALLALYVGFIRSFIQR